MSAEPVDASRPLAGHTSIRAQALRTLVRAIVADAAGVPPGHAAVALKDHGGTLAVTATVPAVLDASSANTPSLVDRSVEIRRRVADGLTRLAGRTAGRVDVRFTGIRRAGTRRVV